VQRFVNTVDFENGIEELTDPAALEQALNEIGAPAGARLDQSDLDRALRVREALRALLLGNNGLEVERPTLATLEEAALCGKLTVEFASDGPAELVATAPGLDGSLGRIVGVIPTAMADGSWPRLKACPRHICRWVFYDRSKNRNSRWCAMSVCGNRIKTAKYRRRAATS
jgi:predicted RNA-binding Zn ribbon-like protein